MMKRLLVVSVLAVMVAVVLVTPAYAYHDPQGSGYVTVKAAHPQAVRVQPAQYAGAHGMSVMLPATGRGAGIVAIAGVLALVVGGAVLGLLDERRRPQRRALAPVSISSYPAAPRERKAA
jgi:hypothetical protein